MTNFTLNTSKTRLKQARIALTQRVNNALQQLKPLQKKDTWIALLKPEPLRRPRRSRAGVTMFDVALWTLVLIPVLVGVLSLYNGVVDSTRSAALRSQLTRAVAIIERDHIYSGVYTADSLLIFLQNEGFTAKELGDVKGSLKFTSPYGTDIAIVPAADNPRQFTVTLLKIPTSGCETAAMTFANKNSGLDSVTIESVAPVVTVDGKTRITEEKVSAECSKADLATVVLTF